MLSPHLIHFKIKENSGSFFTPSLILPFNWVVRSEINCIPKPLPRITSVSPMPLSETHPKTTENKFCSKKV